MQELSDVMTRSYQDSHISKKNLTKRSNMARKINYEVLDIEKKQNQKNIEPEVKEKNSRNHSKH